MANGETPGPARSLKATAAKKTARPAKKATAAKTTRTTKPAVPTKNAGPATHAPPTAAAAPGLRIDRDAFTAIFERGLELDADPTFKENFATEASFAKTPVASRIKPFTSKSTAKLQQTRNPMVLVRVVDGAALPAPNVRLELFNAGNQFLDAVVSDSAGLGLLRFPAESSSLGELELKGMVRVGGTDDHDVTVPAKRDFVVLHVVLQGQPSGSADDAPHDSVVPRLPTFFSVEAADEILRHRATADGPDPCFADAIARQCTYRAPRSRWIYARRIVYDELKVPHRLYVRIRQDWHYIGHSFGQPERIDSRDVASIVGSLDANLQAELAVSGRLDLATASVLSAEASGRLRASASLDGELDASVGLQLFEGGIGNPLSVSGDADVSIRTSLLVSAELKLRASLRNQLHARASLVGRARVGLEADASIAVNPSLSRELNIPRFVIHQNYVVNSFVEDVQEIEEITMFAELSDATVGTAGNLPNWPFPGFPFPPPPPLFPPADIVEYRPIFERQLLEPALAGRFRALRNALDSAAGRGPLVRRLRFEVTYAATTTGRFQARVLGKSVTITLTPNRSQARLVVDLPGGQFFDVLNQEKIDFVVSVALSSLVGNAGNVRITSITAFSDASTRGQTMPLPDPGPFEASTTGPFTAEHKEVDLNLISSDAGLLTDPLVVHINRNPTYYLGLLVRAALRNPSLRFDVPQLRRIGPDHLVWKLPIHGFAGNKALVLVPATGKGVEELLQDDGRSTVVQLAVDGSWSEAMQGENALADLIGQLFPVVNGLELPLQLLDGLTSGAALVPAIVDAGEIAAGLGAAGGAVPSVTGGVLGAVVDVLDV